MLDDLKYIHEKDAQDALGIAERQWQQLEYAFEAPQISGPFENIVFAGMGGSALAALISTSWPGYDVPFYICREYEIPAFADLQTLFIASSYSGNTEETLAALEEAEKRGATIAVIASGGKLIERAQENQYPHLVIPEGYQPRYATLFGLKALMTLLDAAGIGKNYANELALQMGFLQNAVKEWLPTVPASNNYAKQLAQEIMGKSAVVYAGPKLFPAAYKWKISFNENAKNVAWCGMIPEFNHNEFLGWTSHPTEKPYAVIELRSELEHRRVQKRFEVTERLLSGKRPAPIVVNVKGQTVLEQLIWTIALGDFVSMYLALLNGLNPTPVELIEKFKQALD